MTYQCRYCKKNFVKENSLVVHSCEPKRRFMEKDEPGVRLGFQSYLRFYEITQGSSKKKTYEEFAGSPYYRAFVKFGRYCVAIRVINPQRFTEWILKQNKKLDYWCSDKLYTEYLLEYLTLESVEDALVRAIQYGIDWEAETGSPAHDCLRYGNHNALAYAITTGRISPWVLYNCASGQKLLGDFNSDHVGMIWSYIDADKWQKKFKAYAEDQEYARDILQKAGW